MKYLFFLKSEKLLSAIFCIILVLVSHICLSQQLFKITYGNLETFEVTSDSFKSQKELKVPEGFHLDSAIVYFYFPDKKGLVEVDYRPNFDSLKFTKYLNLLKPGSSILFKHIRLRNSEGFIFQPHNIITYHIISGTKPKNKKSSLQ